MNRAGKKAIAYNKDNYTSNPTDNSNMKRIRLLKMEMRSFKGAQQRTIDLGGRDTATISGDNATGKSTVMDAWLWLLWGVNSQDAQTASFGIRPCNPDGTIRTEENPEVAATIEVADDQTGEVATLTLRRKWAGVWRVKRGEAEKTFAKNQGEYYVNDVPVKESEYKAKVEGLLPLDVFKSVTNPYYFPRLPWQDRREVLTAISGDVSYADIAGQRAEFAQLLERISGAPIEERRKELAAKCAKYTKEIEEKPIAISEVERNTPIEPDYAALEKEKADIEGQIAALDAELYSLAGQADRDKARAEKMRQLAAMQGEALSKAQQQAYDAALQANAERNRAEQELVEARQRRSIKTAEAKAGMEHRRRSLKDLEEGREACASVRSKLLSQWHDIDSQAFAKSETLTCPVYNIPCGDTKACVAYAENWIEARDRFNKGKIEQLDAISAKGKQNNKLMADYDRMIPEAKELLAKAEKLMKETEDQCDVEIAQREARLAAMPPRADAKQIRGEDLPEWRSLEEQIQAIKAEMDSGEDQSAAIEHHRQRKAELTAQLDETKRKLGNRQIIEAMKARAKALEKEQQTLLEARAKAQQELMLLDEMERSRMAEVERRVNRHFKRVRFQMSEPTLTTGEEKPCCNCLMDGVKWEDLNTAGKITAGLDIINALCEHYQACAPIFIDNAECTNQEIEATGQAILLKVSRDKELKIS